MTAVALVVGPAEHGVVRHARHLAAAAGWPVATRVDDVPPDGWVVLDVTDRLWGATADVSGPALEAALDRLHARGSRVALALHDVPFDGDGPVAARRAGVYRRIMQRSDGVFVCSEVERVRAASLGGGDTPLAVLPLPVAPRRPAPADAGSRPPPESVTVLGFVYPGKGHAEVLAAMTALPRDMPLVCAGRASDGHVDLLDELRAGERPVHVTGFVSDDDLVALLQAPTIPVAPNRVVSASASIATWWEHARRPLVPDLPYTREVGTDATVGFYDDLAAALDRALAEPGSTWLAPGIEAGPSVAEVVARRDAWLDRWST